MTHLILDISSYGRVGYQGCFKCLQHCLNASKPHSSERPQTFLHIYCMHQACASVSGTINRSVSDLTLQKWSKCVTKKKRETQTPSLYRFCHTCSEQTPKHRTSKNTRSTKAFYIHSAESSVSFQVISKSVQNDSYAVIYRGNKGWNCAKMRRKTDRKWLQSNGKHCSRIPRPVWM